MPKLEKLHRTAVKPIKKGGRVEYYVNKT